MSGATSVLEFTGPRGEKARVYFENGQVRHAVAPGKEGTEAFNEIVNWKGGTISEVSGAGESPRTIDLDWQILLMEAVRAQDESREAGADETKTSPPTTAQRKILVIDDSVMLLNFVDGNSPGGELFGRGCGDRGRRLAGGGDGYAAPDFARLHPAGHERGRGPAVACCRNRPLPACRWFTCRDLGPICPTIRTKVRTSLARCTSPLPRSYFLGPVETHMPNDTGESLPEGIEEDQPNAAQGWAPVETVPSAEFETPRSR